MLCLARLTATEARRSSYHPHPKMHTGFPWCGAVCGPRDGLRPGPQVASCGGEIGLPSADAQAWDVALASEAANAQGNHFWIPALGWGTRAARQAWNRHRPRRRKQAHPTGCYIPDITIDMCSRMQTIRLGEVGGSSRKRLMAPWQAAQPQCFTEAACARPWGPNKPHQPPYTHVAL